jgi:hypothetical protein
MFCDASPYSPIFTSSLFRTLPICLGGVVTLVDDQILGSVILAAREVALEDVLGTRCVSRLCIQRRAGHVRNHAIATVHGVLCVAERMILWCGLWEPDITTIAVKVATLQCLGNILLDNDGAPGSVDEVST